MRTIRSLTIGIALVAAVPMTVAAQHGRGFKDAWFWGVRGGGLSVADSGGDYDQAPMIGIDWLVTRTHGGVYLSASEAYFSQHIFTLFDPFRPDSGFTVRVRNLHRFDAAAMAFPGDVHSDFHPYGGVGFTLSDAATIRTDFVFVDFNRFHSAQLIIRSRRASISPFFIAGGQYRISDISIFGQATLSPTQRSFILYNGRPWNFGYELGLRYNIGPSIAKDDP
jgi:hypothetical protein